jgi:NAD(P)-dependent dehydrogenase (short-subunit alcohol dehydrogenase family)
VRLDELRFPPPFSSSQANRSSLGRRLSGSVVLVSGASSGIGRACAVMASREGAEVIAVARRDRLLHELVEEIEGEGGTICAIPLDMTDPVLVQRVFDGLGQIDALVNCAGTNIPEPIEHVTEEHFDRVFAINVRSLFFASQAAVGAMRRQGKGGAIVNISSQMGHVGAIKRTVYCASKHAVEGFTKALALEVAADGIRVNSVCPTFIETPMTGPMFEDDHSRREVVSRIPMGRIGTPEEVASAVVFLASREASLITGTSLLLDGGWTAQ